MNDIRQYSNTSKRLPIVFCLDVSPSMGWKIGTSNSSIELLNIAVNNFIKELKDDPKASACAEVAFVTFSSNIEMDTQFASVWNTDNLYFDTVESGGTNMAQAVIRSIEKIEQRRNHLRNMEIPYYAPFLVLVTDGNPDNNDALDKHAKAVDLVKSHCDSHIGASEIIVPFVIGVGDRIESKTLNEYSAGFTKGYFPIKGNADKAKLKFKQVFQLIGSSTKKSIHLNTTAKEVLEIIRYDMNELYNTLHNE